MILSDIQDILNLFYPNTCIGCKNHLSYNNHLLCLSCFHDLPYSYYSKQKNNPIEQIFYGKTPIKGATSLFLFQEKSILQTIIHELKYKNNKHIGLFLGKLLAFELSLNKQFLNLDYILPVPIHAKKLKQRGYNQLTKVGCSLSDELGIPFIENLLIKTGNSKTQTKKSKTDRWQNTQASFFLKDIKRFENKNILLIDDVITTGATLVGCAKELCKTKNISISIATIAHTINF